MKIEKKISQLSVGINCDSLENMRYHLTEIDEFSLFPIAFKFDEYVFATEFMAKQIDYDAIDQWLGSNFKDREHHVLLIDGTFDFDFEYDENTETVKLMIQLSRDISFIFHLDTEKVKEMFESLRLLIENFDWKTYSL